MPMPWKRPDSSGQFEVECECGEQFRVPYGPESTTSRPGDPFLIPLEGRCPWCGLRLEEIDLFEFSKQ